MTRIPGATKVLALCVAVAVASLTLMAGARKGAQASANPQVHQMASFADQAMKGHEIYTQQCAACHQDDLSGTDMVPALAGPAFMARWEGKTGKDLFDHTRMTMPASNPGGLMSEEYLNATAYILQSNDITPPQDLTLDNLASIAIHK
jgi:alcohol dehydrogenase (cytochrome c)